MSAQARRRARAYGAPPAAKPVSVDVVALIDHHGAKLYRIDLSSGEGLAETVRPYNPHHCLHHLHHCDELREHGQRAPEDLTFYDRIAEALHEADRVALLCHGVGLSNAVQILAERLKRRRPDICARIVRQAEVITSEMTEREILAYGRQSLTTDVQEGHQGVPRHVIGEKALCTRRQILCAVNRRDA